MRTFQLRQDSQTTAHRILVQVINYAACVNMAYFANIFIKAPTVCVNAVENAEQHLTATNTTRHHHHLLLLIMICEERLFP